jgi:superfamily II DNA or RNA helicase
LTAWETSTELTDAVEEQAEAVLAAYAADPDLVEEHAGQELEARTGGYGRRQVFELIQNGADQLEPGSGRLQIVVTESGLYCANEGRPFTVEGLVSILHAYLSGKDDRQIGRFGLGFKSVLGVTSRPTVLSRSGSFQFGPEIAAKIRGVVPTAERVPILRIAAPVDPGRFFEADPIAAELSAWAATVIVLPFDAEEPDPPWLGRSVATFPRAFLAFADGVESLALEDRPADVRRVIGAEWEEAAVEVREGEDSETWLIFESDVELDDGARRMAGKLADRDEATIKWAVRPDGDRDLGQFWSYFPTDDETTLRGVVNAPWQLSEDRRRLVDGPYNEALLDGAARLVLDSLEDLRRHQSDPTAYLELMPGRGREPRCWADGLLTEWTNERMRFEPSVPLIGGELELPAAARLHPPDPPGEAMSLWSSIAEPGNWVDHRVESQKDRRARVERYMSEAGQAVASQVDWFTAAIGTPAVDEAIRLARLARLLFRGSDADDVVDIPFVLTESLEYVAPSAPGLMLPGEFARDAEVTLVHPALAADEGACVALEALGLRRVSAEVELRRLAAADPDEIDWGRFWKVARQADPAGAAATVAEAGLVPRVRTLAGDFRSIVVTLLPGPCVPADGSRDAGVAIDVGWHREEITLLRRLGCSDGPSVGARVDEEPWFAEYRDACLQEFLDANAPAKPAPELIEVTGDSPTVGPLTALRALGEDGQAAVTQMALQAFDRAEAWTVCHRTQDHYRTVRTLNPSLWMIASSGLLHTPYGPRPVEECVGPELAWKALVPAPTCGTVVARALGLPASWAEVDMRIVAECLAAAAEADVGVAGGLYTALARVPEVEPPASIRCLKGGLPTEAVREAVAVSSDPEVVELLAGGTQCVLPVSDRDGVDALIASWNLIDARSLVARRVAVAASSDPLPLLDVFPPLRRRLEPSMREVEIQRCEEIRVIEEAVGGTRSTDIDCVRDEGRIYYLDSMAPEIVLAKVGAELGLVLDRDEVDRILRGIEDRRVKELIREARQAPTDELRLSTLLDAEQLRAGLPRSVLEIYSSLHGDPAPANLASLALSVHGSDVLRRYAEALEEAGLNPPSGWNGGRAAREFVRSLGFPAELAGFRGKSLPPEVVIEARPRLAELHEYQRVIADEMLALLSRDKDNRAMLTLPTGSGKTRVAIEGCIDAIAARVLHADLVLWVAQSQELCDQAVQAWGELWRARELDSRLTIGRLWSSNDVDPVAEGEAQVVVATIQKLQNVIDQDAYAWLARPGAVIIDEAHGSITPSYTRLLGWLGLERGRFGTPLVGLSATPYRGRSEEETERLAKRYGKRRLDAVLGEGDHYPLLQEMGVISRVAHRTVEGTVLELSPEQLDETRRLGRLPSIADARLGEDAERSRRLLDDIVEQPEDWPVLVFAPSVENAQALAGLLNHRGIKSAAISAETPDEARRWYLDRFRDGELRVITNYSVLAEGFDAPSVRAVYVARPVFAPNRYQQMVGRGLRGPLNGGNAECLIVDVEDNLINLDELLAFHQFEYLWNPQWAVSTADV